MVCHLICVSFCLFRTEKYRLYWSGFLCWVKGWRQKLPVLVALGSHCERCPALQSGRKLHKLVKSGLQLFVIFRPFDCLCCSCTLCVLDQRPDRGIATICVYAWWDTGALWGLLLLLPILSFSGTWMVCFCFGLTPFVRFSQKKIFPKVKTAGTVVSEVRGEE